jgi:hypothetical protein
MAKMTGCNEIREAIYDRLDSGSRLGDDRVIEQHVKVCESCARFEREMLEVHRGLSDLREMSVLPNSRVVKARFLIRAAAAVAFLLITGASVRSWLMSTGFSPPDDRVAVVVDSPFVADPVDVLVASSTAKLIAVPAPTTDSHVHVVWFHRVTQSVAEKRRELPGPGAGGWQPGDDGVLASAS